MKKFNFFIISYCIVLIVAIVVKVLVESKTDYEISAVYTSYMIYLEIFAVLLVLLGITINIIFQKNISYIIKTLIFVLLVSLSLIISCIPLLFEEKVYTETINNTEYIVVERGFMVESRRYYHKKKDNFLMEKRVSYARKISEKSPIGEKEDYLN